MRDFSLPGRPPDHATPAPLAPSHPPAPHTAL